MNTLFDEDDRGETKSDADLTLGIGSLLSIFFGVVLICGIFFGFGYSMGRRNARPAILPAATQPAQAAATAPPLPENELSGAPLKPAAPDDTSASPSNSADSTPEKTSAPAKQAAPDNSAAKPSKTTRGVEPAATDPSLSAVPYAHRPPLPTKPHAGISAPLAQAPGDSPIIPGHPIMVQIAAVSRQEDAEVLAGALRKRGFNPTVRPGTSDTFFHVQVGPFTDKPQADAMKQQLLADGYNAIVK
jgi:cell division septation protein DedD